MNRTHTAYSIARSGHCVSRGDHLIASNDECTGCNCAETGDYRQCDLHVQASRDSLAGLWRDLVSMWPLYAILGGWAVFGWLLSA